MPRFSLRHLLLLISFFCLWLGAYAYWRNVAVFAVPLLCGYSSAIVGFLHFNKNPSLRLRRVGFLTLVNMVGTYIGLWMPVSMIKSSWGLSAICFVWVAMLQGHFLAFQALMSVATSSRPLIVLGILLSAINLVMAFLMLQVLLDLSYFL